MKKATARKAPSRRGTEAPARGGQATTVAVRGSRARASASAASHVAQVRLQADEMEALREVMRQLSLRSTSEALREGLRLLVREAAEVAAADEIRRFYGEQPVLLPEGVTPATKEELAAADAEQW
jgi:hypothetical protein